MTASLTPPLALAYLRELSVDVCAAVVVDVAGAPLAGDADLAPRVRALLGAAEGAASGVTRGQEADNTLLAVRAENGLAIAVVAGPCALLPLLAHDLAAVAQELSATASSDD